MIGYIYLTENLINGKIYIGKHHKTEYDDKYYGSGVLLLKALNKYGIENFKNTLIDTADTVEELNEKEKYYISYYREQNKVLYNIAKGGDGGDTLSDKSAEEKEEFINKMTKINKERCSSQQFKDNTSKRMTARYKDEEERQKQSIRIRRAWSDDTLRYEQSERLKKYFQNNKKDNSYNYKPCRFELNGLKKDFESVQKLKKFLREEYNISFSNPTLSNMLKTEEPYNPFFSRFYQLKGMKLSLLK